MVSLLKMLFFHSYVSLPEGICRGLDQRMNNVGMDHEFYMLPQWWQHSLKAINKKDLHVENDTHCFFFLYPFVLFIDTLVSKKKHGSNMEVSKK